MLLPPLWAIVASYIDPIERPMLADLPWFAPVRATRPPCAVFIDPELIHVLIWYWDTRHRPERVGSEWDWGFISVVMCEHSNVRGLEWALSVGAPVDRPACRLAAAQSGCVPLLKLLGVDQNFLADPEAIDMCSPQVLAVIRVLKNAHTAAMDYIKSQRGYPLLLRVYRIAQWHDRLPGATILWMRANAD